MKISTLSPIDGSVYVERELASGPIIEKTLDKAEQARKAWRNTSFGRTNRSTQ